MGRAELPRGVGSWDGPLRASILTLSPRCGLLRVKPSDSCARLLLLGSPVAWLLLPSRGGVDDTAAFVRQVREREPEGVGEEAQSTRAVPESPGLVLAGASSTRRWRSQASGAELLRDLRLARICELRGP